MEKKMKSYHQKFVSDHPYESSPMAEIAGFPVRPGIYDLNGATPLQNGVNFTIHTCGGTSCELLLFHRAQEEPFAVLPFPEAPHPSNRTITGILCSLRAICSSYNLALAVLSRALTSSFSGICSGFQFFNICIVLPEII